MTIVDDRPMHCYYLLQLNIYAKYTSHLTVVRENTFARSVCAEELESIYYSNDNPSFVFVIVCSTIILPMFSLMLIVFSIRNVDDNIINSFTDSTNHGTMVAFVITGMWITIGIFLCDVLACNVLRGNHEYSSDIKGMSINLHIAYGTLVCDIIFICLMLLCILYIGIRFCFNHQDSVVPHLPPTDWDRVHYYRVWTLVSMVVGKNTYNKIEKLSIISLIFPFMLITPILCISSHIGYIMLAWLTEPSKCTTIAILYYSFLLFIFFTLRKAYNTRSELNICNRKAQNGNKPQQGSDEPSTEKETKFDSTDGSASQEETSGATSGSRNSESLVKTSRQNAPNQPANKKDVNTQAFCLLLFYGVFIIAIAVIFTLVFLLLPLASEELVRYLFELFQLMVVLVSGLVTYKLFFSESTFKSVIKKFKETYKKLGANDNANGNSNDANDVFNSIASKDENLTDIAGEFGAELTHVIVCSLKSQE